MYSTQPTNYCNYLNIIIFIIIACIGSSDIPVQINHAYEEVKFQSQQQRQHGLARQQQRQNHQDVILTHSHFQT